MHLVTRLIFAFFFFTVISASVYADDQSLTPAFAPQRPESLSPLGIKIWQTLIDGNPQWSNWQELISKTPSSLTVQEEFSKVLTAFKRQLYPNDANDPNDHPLSHEYRDLLFQQADQTEVFQMAGATFPTPAYEILKSFDMVLGTGPKQQPMELLQAQQLAFRELQISQPRLQIHHLDLPEKRQLNRLTWKYLMIDGTNPRGATERAFEEWRRQALSYFNSIYDADTQKRYSALIHDEVLYPHFYAVPLQSPKMEIYRLQDIVPFGTELKVFHSKNPQWLEDAIIEFHRRHRDSKLALNRDRPIDADNFVLYLDSPLYGPLGITPFAKKDDGLRWLFERGETSPYSEENFRLAVYNSLDGESSTRYDVIKSTIQKLKWLGSAESTRSTILALTDQVEANGYDSSRPIASRTDWKRAYLTEADNMRATLDQRDRSKVEEITLLYQWQVVTRGREFWNRLASEAERSNLPRLDFKEEIKDEYGQSQPNDPGPDRKNYLVGKLKGNHEISDINEKTILLKAFQLDPEVELPEVRLTPLEEIRGAIAVQVSRAPGKIRIRGDGLSAKNLYQGILILPTPAGFRPTRAQSVIRLTTGLTTLELKGPNLKFIQFPQSHTYGVSLHELANVNAISSVDL
jgi:hypothetical protein